MDAEEKKRLQYMLKLPSTFAQAKELLAMKPLPPNARDIMAGLRLQTPEKYLGLFDELSEALIVAESLGEPGAPT